MFLKIQQVRPIYLPMLSHSKLLLFAGWFTQVLATGTQFLSIPASAYDLIIFHSPWRNPATLNQVNRAPELGFTYGHWLAGTQTTNVKWRGQIRQASGGLDIRYVGMDDIEFRPNKPTSKPFGHYAAYGLSFRSMIGWERGAHQFGVGIQFVNMQIYQESASGMALDFGWGWSFRHNLKFTLSALNMGKMNALSALKPQLPQRIISTIIFEQPTYSAFLGMESNNLVQNPILYVGGKGHYNNLFMGGTFMHTDGMKSISSGVGVQFGIYTVAYGIQWGDQHLGMPQMIDISIRLP